MNKHTSFVPLPDKVNLTQLSYDFKRFSRSMRWREKNADLDSTACPEKIFNVKKFGLPSNAPSAPLGNFLYGVESDLSILKSKKVYSNLKESEKQALQSLVAEQKESNIVIQRADKGGALAIMDRNDYINKVESEHLNSKITTQDGTCLPVYRRIDPSMVKVHYCKIKETVEQAENRGLINNELAAQLLPDQPSEARAYAMPKAHKPVADGEKLPPTRLVISGCASNTENISHFVNHYSKHIPEQTDSFIQDTPDLLRFLEEANKGPDIPSNAILVSIDVVGLYPNIPQDEGIDAFREAMHEPKYGQSSMCINFIITLLQYVLQFNSFIFNEKFYLQEWGTSIGTKVAPTYANIFMNKLETEMLKKFKGTLPAFWKRYIDDIICLFVGNENDLLKFLTFISSYHPTIKFTCEYRLNDVIVKTKWKNGNLDVNRLPIGNVRPRSIDFLDCTIWINDLCKFECDLFTKDTDRITYLMPQSCHPSFICRNIPYSLAYRLKRICTSNENFLLRLNELKINLLSRGYNAKIIVNAFDKLKNIPRSKTLEKVIHPKQNNRVMFSLTYDPRIINVNDSIKKHYVIANKDPSFKISFPKMPMVGYKRARNLGDHLIRAKLYPIHRYEMRNRNGFFKCSKRDIGCDLCNHSQNITEHVASHSKKKYPIKSKIKCSDSYIIYSIQCKKCDMQYVGQTTTPVCRRFNSHSWDIINKKNEKPVPKHFNSRNHSHSDMIFTPFEKLNKKDKTLLDVREKYWILEKNTVIFGLNRNY